MSHQSTQQVLQAVSEFNRYFTSANDAEPNARISVPTKEWNALHFMLFSTLSKHAEPSSPLLVRDVAELIGSTVPDVCKALVQLGHGQRSTNAAVHPEEAIAVAKLLAQPAEGGEPYYGHQFKEIRKGVWLCKCGKQITEGTTSCTNGTPNTSTQQQTADAVNATLTHADSCCAPRAQGWSIRVGSSQSDTPPASQEQAQQPIAQAWANKTGLRQIECPSCGGFAVAYDPQQPKPQPMTDDQIMAIAFSRRFTSGEKYLIELGQEIASARDAMWAERQRAVQAQGDQP